MSLVKDLDVVIDAVGGTTNIEEQSQLILDAASAAASRFRPSNAPKLTYIYTSGTWVHGDDRHNVKVDTSPITSPIELVAWRPDQEQRVIHSKILNGVVIRPSLLYGKSGSLFASLFERASQGTVSWPGTPGGRLATVHTDDLAELYLLVTERAPTLGGLVFDASNSFSEPTDFLLESLVSISGAKGPYQYTEPSNRKLLSVLSS